MVVSIQALVLGVDVDVLDLVLLARVRDRRVCSGEDAQKLVGWLYFFHAVSCGQDVAIGDDASTAKVNAVYAERNLVRVVLDFGILTSYHTHDIFVSESVYEGL